MRSCLPLTILSPQLVDNAVLHPLVKREILIRETERTMIAGADAGWWDGNIRQYNDTRFFTPDVDYSALELRILAQQQKALRFGSIYGRGSSSRLPFMQDRDIVYTTQEMSPNHLKEKILQAYAHVDAWSTKHMWDSILVLDSTNAPTPKSQYEVRMYGLQHKPDARRFMLNYDALFPR